MSAAKSYTLDDLQYQTANIHQLLETIHDQILEMDFGTGAGRNHQLDRVSALVCVARDYSENLCESISTHYDAIQSKGGAA